MDLPDEIGYASLAAHHLLGYAGHDPVNFVDPSGLAARALKMGHLAKYSKVTRVQYEKIVEKARRRYPRKARIKGPECHHVHPIYMGGPKSPMPGGRKAVDAAYHQLLTNSFRNYWSYGAGASKTGLNFSDIMTIVYADLPVGHLPDC